VTAIRTFVQRASPRDLRWMATLTVLAGLANGLLIVMINDVAGLVAVGERPGLWLCLGFAAAFAIYYVGNRYALIYANRMIEGLLHRLRLDVADRLRRAELPDIDRLGRGTLYTTVAQETNHLSVSFPLLVDSLQQGVLLVIALGYLLYLSPAAFIVFLAAMLIAVLGYQQINRRYGDTLRQLGRRQADMLDAVADVVNGAKELRLSRRRAAAVDVAFARLSRRAQALLVVAGEHWAALITLSSMITYLILGVIGFGFPDNVGQHGIIVFQLIPVLLFCLGPPVKILAQAPLFLRAEVGLQSILDIEARLAASGALSPDEARAAAPRFRGFREITYAGLRFSHRDRTGAASFAVGPLELTVRRGETLFIVGGNGSGKSTTLRLLTGLYPLEAGGIRVDGVPLVGRDIGGFRELFAAVFVDFHLFDRLYGLEKADPVRVAELLEEVGLAGKVRFEDGRFSQLHLSTGQRKRLALVAALLEDREILVFDEWSAEQDPHYRAWFYNTVLPRLKAAGRTVIAVTHDERFWPHADRIVKLDLGRVEWERAGGAA
jgi:putative ATP-binding cassette transporter